MLKTCSFKFKCNFEKFYFIFSGLSRHQRELALCVKPNSKETKLLAFALSCQSNEKHKPNLHPIDHPINNLAQIHDEQFSYSDASPLKTSKMIIRKRRQLLQSYTKPIEVIYLIYPRVSNVNYIFRYIKIWI